MMSHYAKGRRGEYKVQRILEAAGYDTVRSAGSKGMWDVIAWNRLGARFIQVKAGDCSPSRLEREAIDAAVVPDGATKEIWLLRDRQAPLIEVC